MDEIAATRDHMPLPEFVVIYRGLPPRDVVTATETLLAVGFMSFEVSLISEKALESVAALAQRFGAQALIGAGTVMSVQEVEQVAERGARMMLSPVADEAVISAARDRGLLTIPGAYTPTEIAKAHAWGADVVKLFPAASGGTRHLKLVRDPLPHIPLLATGGLSADDAGEFLAGGAISIGVGIGLLGGDAAARRDWSALATRAEQYRQVATRRSAQ